MKTCWFQLFWITLSFFEVIVVFMQNPGWGFTNLSSLGRSPSFWSYLKYSSYSLLKISLIAWSKVYFYLHLYFLDLIFQACSLATCPQILAASLLSQFSWIPICITNIVVHYNYESSTSFVMSKSPLAWCTGCIGGGPFI